MITTRFRKGDPIHVFHRGVGFNGTMMMISENQVAALLMFDGLIDGHVGMMPVQLDDPEHGTYRSIITGTTVTVRKDVVFPFPGGKREDTA